MTKLKSVIEAAKKNEAGVANIKDMADAVEKFYEDDGSNEFPDVHMMLATVEMAYDNTGKNKRLGFNKATDLIEQGFKMLIADMRKSDTFHNFTAPRS